MFNITLNPNNKLVMLYKFLVNDYVSSEFYDWLHSKENKTRVSREIKYNREHWELLGYRVQKIDN